MAVRCSLLEKSRTHFPDFSDVFKNKWRKEKEEGNQTNWSFWMSFVQMRPQVGEKTPSVTSLYKTIFKQKILFIATLLTVGKNDFMPFKLLKMSGFGKRTHLVCFDCFLRKWKLHLHAELCFFLKPVSNLPWFYFQPGQNVHVFKCFILIGSSIMLSTEFQPER